MFVCNIQLPKSTNKNDNKNNENRNTNKMWRDETDSPQVLIGDGFRGVPILPSLQAYSTSIQESLDNVCDILLTLIYYFLNHFLFLGH